MWRQHQLVPLPLADRQAPSPPRGSGNVACLDSEIVTKFADDTAAYLHDVQNHFGISIQRIAIDAPSDPKIQGYKRRQAECELDAHGVSCFATPSLDEFEVIKNKVYAHLEAGGKESHLPHANQLWMLVGFELFKRLRIEWECLEVFPQATAFVLRSNLTHKSEISGVETQLRAASQFTGWPEPFDLRVLSKVVRGPLHDGLDAYLSAWVAALNSQDRTGFGTAPYDVIWVPKVDLLSIKQIHRTAFSRR
ncbi:MAG TPA: DUF429 domain-containing protein [Alphaproteobacteria bacterium]|nr:DUF429 domain-containing protein [Alphaproteobacteria bacterium]